MWSSYALSKGLFSFFEGQNLNLFRSLTLCHFGEGEYVDGDTLSSSRILCANDADASGRGRLLHLLICSLAKTWPSCFKSRRLLCSLFFCYSGCISAHIIKALRAEISNKLKNRATSHRLVFLCTNMYEPVGPMCRLRLLSSCSIQLFLEFFFSSKMLLLWWRVISK